MVADTPVEVQLLAQLLELDAEQVEATLDELMASYEVEDRGFILTRVAGGYRYQSHPELAAYVERFVLEGQSSRLSAAGARDAGHRRLQAADLAGPGGRHPGRQRRRRRPHVGAAGLHHGGRPRPGPGQPLAVRHDGRVPGEDGLASSTTCRPSPISCPGPRWSSSSSTGCEPRSPTTSSPSSTVPARSRRPSGSSPPRRVGGRSSRSEVEVEVVGPPPSSRRSTSRLSDGVASVRGHRGSLEVSRGVSVGQVEGEVVEPVAVEGVDEPWAEVVDELDDLVDDEPVLAGESDPVTLERGRPVVAPATEPIVMTVTEPAERVITDDPVTLDEAGPGRGRSATEPIVMTVTEPADGLITDDPGHSRRGRARRGARAEPVVMTVTDGRRLITDDPVTPDRGRAERGGGVAARPLSCRPGGSGAPAPDAGGDCCGRWPGACWVRRRTIRRRRRRRRRRHRSGPPARARPTSTSTPEEPLGRHIAPGRGRGDAVDPRSARAPQAGPVPPTPTPAARFPRGVPDRCRRSRGPAAGVVGPRRAPPPGVSPAGGGTRCPRLRASACRRSSPASGIASRRRPRS
jgi:hypothetical protein